MITVDFDHTKKKYDRYGRFYMNRIGLETDYCHRPLVQFETGEVLLESFRWNPAFRKEYPQVGLSLYFHNDRKMPKLFLNGEHVPTAHLYLHGAQKLVVDHKMGLAVSATGYNADLPQTVPEFFRKCPVNIGALWLNPDAAPIGSRKIFIMQPDRASKTEREEIDGIKAACKMWLTMQSEKDDDIKRMIQYSWARPRSPANREDILGKPFTEIERHVKIAVALKGVMPKRKKIAASRLSLSQSDTSLVKIA